MEFSTESYVRIYTRDTATWNRLGWEGQTVLMHLLRRVDRSGTYTLAGWEPAEALAFATRGPVDFIRAGLAVLFELRIVETRGESLFVPRFKEAQTSKKSASLRQREWRTEPRGKVGASKSDQEALDFTPSQDSETDSQDSLDVDSSSLSIEYGASHETTSNSPKAQQSKVKDLSSSSLSAEQSTCQVVGFRTRSQSLAAVGYRWLDEALGSGGRAPDMIAWQRHYERIGSKPLPERIAVAKHMMLTPYIIECLRKAKPEHLLRYWDEFVVGPRLGYKPPVKSGPGTVSQTHESDDHWWLREPTVEAAQ
jgi:hypothetical protein